MSQRAMVRDSILILVLFSQLTVFCCVLVAERAVFLSVNALLLHRPSQPASVLFFSSRVFERLLSRSLAFVFLFIYYYFSGSRRFANAFAASFELYITHTPSTKLCLFSCFSCNRAICRRLSASASRPCGVSKATFFNPDLLCLCVCSQPPRHRSRLRIAALPRGKSLLIRNCSKSNV